MAHEGMIASLGIALGINLWGVFVLFVPINYLIPEQIVEKTRNHFTEKFPVLRDHIKKINKVSNKFTNDRLDMIQSKEKREEVISEVIETYEYDYLAVFLLSCLPIPFLGTIMTGAAIFTVEALEIKFGLFVIMLAKITKVFALAAIGYFAHFI